ncbi:hypothetical protein CPARA_1gp115 (nucleomorph) [Cryptomonas paramecium]|uniref:Uncharacterized protein n=1 Tax=Cryptomonas paramaecium TaxID=2898 RepID=F2HHH7_9CRYP|nr:hypothetical protein CPARA_1gp115 [Cryptomonas paramecium]AEA38773.1 hypothetical protein CPARA_1gp115 [Cryptomonas paramecium]|mmetsp:Transcript_16193/g.43953  ORF Transcript_16193/g.43953 Transcript_16193/m.43953 type:complete len:104 (-) Transcript_16193:3877-4188(-)
MMNESNLRKNLHMKCADVIELGDTFKQYHKFNDKNFSILLEENQKNEGSVYKKNNKISYNSRFILRIFRPKSTKILLTMWKSKKISFWFPFSNDSSIAKFKIN